MRKLRLTLLGDGSSDRCLLFPIRWLVSQIVDSAIVESEFADLGQFADQSPGAALSQRIPLAMKYYPCDVLFVHRDAEREAPAARYDEIAGSMARAWPGQRWVGIVPVRMTEAWLLVEERAVRIAADNPNGVAPLGLPEITELEHLPDPKAALHRALEAACEKRGRRLEQFQRDRSWRVQRVASLIRDLSRLRRLSSFRRLEDDTRRVLAEFG